MKRLLAVLVIALVTLLLAGCNPGYKSGAAAWSGGELEILKPVPIKAGRARAFFQGGVLVGFSGMDQYYPGCSLEIRNLSQETQFIQPGRYRITRVVQNYTEIVSRQPVQVASLVDITNRDAGKLIITRYYQFWLAQSEQTNFLRMSCYGGFQDYIDSRLPTPDEIRQSLGDHATLHL